jgi:hypothetical protein
VEAGPVDVRVARGERSEADAAGAVPLRERVDDDDEILVAFERQGRDRLPPVVDELAVDLVADEEEAVVAAERRDREDLLAGVDRPGRVVRVAEDDEPGPRRQLRLRPAAEVEPVPVTTGTSLIPPSRRRSGSSVERLDEERLVPGSRP